MIIDKINTCQYFSTLIYIRNSYENVIVLLNVLHGDTCQCVGTAIPGLTLLFISLIFFFYKLFLSY